MMTKVTSLVLLLQAILLGGWINKSGKPIPDLENRKAIGDFGAQLILVADENKLIKTWSHPSDTVDVNTTGVVNVNGVINAFIVFIGCAPDKNGKCNVSMRFRVVRPDGKVYADTPPMEVWNDKPAPPGRSLELSVQYLKVVIEPKDLLGKYVVYAQVRDDHTNSVLQLQSPFVAASPQ